jgi:hypothetical protein
MMMVACGEGRMGGSLYRRLVKSRFGVCRNRGCHGDMEAVKGVA